MRIQTLAGLAAVVIAATTTVPASAGNFCHFKNGKWVGCNDRLGPPPVGPERHVSMRAPQANAVPAHGCIRVGHVPGHDRWRCPRGTADKLRPHAK
jgi:hypothetical protein